MATIRLNTETADQRRLREREIRGELFIEDHVTMEEVIDGLLRPLAALIAGHRDPKLLMKIVIADLKTAVDRRMEC